MDEVVDNEGFLMQQALANNRRQQAGRSKGQSNFKVDEDMKLASAYVLVGTNAAVGTDQDGTTFWQKIRENFIRRGGNPERTIISLQNRFNKVLQCEVQKYVGYLQGALREPHSGWIMEDYVQDAKKQYLIRQGKVFKHDMVYSILKSLPKFELVIASIDARVARALNLLDNDSILAGVNQQQEGRGGNRNNNNHASEGLFASLENTNSAADNYDRVPDSSLITPRPSIGKKKAKEIAFARSGRGYNKHQFNTPTSADSRRKAAELKNVERSKHTLVLTRIAEVAEAKHKFAQEKLLAQIYLQNPNSARAKAFFARMESRYDIQEQEQQEVTERYVEDRSHAGDSEEDEEQEQVTERYEPFARRAPPLSNHANRTQQAVARTETYHARRAAVLRHPAPNVELRYDDDDDDDELLDNLPSLPNTQNLMAMVRAMEKRTEDPPTNIAGGALDSQATTLEQHDDDSMHPHARIVGDLREHVTLPPVIDFSRIKGSDFDSGNDNDQE